MILRERTSGGDGARRGGGEAAGRERALGSLDYGFWITDFARTLDARALGAMAAPAGEKFLPDLAKAFQEIDPAAPLSTRHFADACARVVPIFDHIGARRRPAARPAAPGAARATAATRRRNRCRRLEKIRCQPTPQH